MSIGMKKKVLLMGKSGSGKTSMRSIIFANYMARDTNMLAPTYRTENTDVKFFGDLVLNLWDCGGQDAFMESYFESQRDQIFCNVQVLIYVFDVETSDWERDMIQYNRCLNAIQEKSSDAHVFCLIHKMDLLQDHGLRLQTFSQRAEELTRNATSVQVTCYGTSIWDETLYKAWSAIVHSLVPNANNLKEALQKLCLLCSADEIVIFESESFLVISSAENPLPNHRHNDPHRYEKMSNIIKQFKLSCLQTRRRFEAIELSNVYYSAYIRTFTKSTYIMIVTSDSLFTPAGVEVNLAAARTMFEMYLSMRDEDGGHPYK